MKKKTSAKRTGYERPGGVTGLLKEFWKSLPDAVYVLDREGRFILANDAFARLAGLTVRQIAGRAASDLDLSDGVRKLVEDDATVLKAGKPVLDRIKKGAIKRGRQQYFSVTKIPRLGSRKTVTGLIGIIRDETRNLSTKHPDRKRIDRAEKQLMIDELNRNKSEFLAAISHELRSPMAIALQLFLLVFDETAGPVNNKQREILVRLRNNMERLRKMIDNLLDLSVMEGEGIKLQYSLANLNDLILESRDFFTQKAAERGIKLKYSLPKRDVCIFVDGERIVQVIANLMNNAIKFTKQDGLIRIEVKLLEDKVRVGFIDNGIGIAEAQLPKIFDKFVQVFSEKEVERKGIGMGLAIVRELVEHHGGEVWAESKRGVGTKVFFTLPRFYTANLPPRHALDRIDKYLIQGISVYVINVRVINHKEFIKRMGADAWKILDDFKGVIQATMTEFFHKQDLQAKDVIPDVSSGRYTLILPDAGEEDVNKFCVLLRTRMKEYLAKNRIENVFVVLGISTFSSQEYFKDHGEDRYPYVTIREVYVGPEVRRYKRINYSGDIDVSLPDGTGGTFQFADLSQGGLCFLSPVGSEKFKGDMILDVKFNLARKGQAVTTKARVAWVGKIKGVPGQRADQYKIGIEFFKTKPKDQNNLMEELKLYYA